jgi:copper resistance protein B
MGHCTMPPAPTAEPVKPPTAMPASTCTPEHAAMGHCTTPATTGSSAATPTAPSPATAACPPEHAAMGHCTPAGAPQGDPHAGHSMGQTAPTAPIAPPPPAAFSGPAHAADLVYNDAAMAEAREEMREEHGGLETYKLLIDQLEVGIRDGHDTYAWDGQFWYGGDIDKLWIKTEGEGEFGAGLESAEVQALWSRAIDPWFDVQLGVRHDFRPQPQRTHLVLGVQGLAPYWFEVDGAVFLSDKGDVTARFEGEYDLRLTQRLILQPLAELDFSLQDIPELGIGAGLSTAEIGARLRYEFFPSFGPAVVAPYVGVEYERAFGDTADFRRAAGEDTAGWSFLVGLRTWF